MAGIFWVGTKIVFIVSAKRGPSDRKTAADWRSLPVPVLVAVLVVLAGITHALIGVRSVVLDYVHTRTGALCRHGLSIDLRSLAEIGGRTDSSVAHRIAGFDRSSCHH